MAPEVPEPLQYQTPSGYDQFETPKDSYYYQNSLKT